MSSKIILPNILSQKDKVQKLPCIPRYLIYTKSLLMLAITTLVSCEKLVSIGPPIDTITTTQVFSSEAQAKSAMAGIYTQLANGMNGGGIAMEYFSTGLTTIAGAFSADELHHNYMQFGDMYELDINQLHAANGITPTLWSSLYNTIYGTNAVVEGLEAGTSRMSDKIKKELMGEARFLRAFCYFYLVNFFGEVPLVLTVDFNDTRGLAKAPQQLVYKQIIDDLLFAQASLPPDFSAGKGERIIPNKWAATALLSRVYLYTGDHLNAHIQSNAVIEQAGTFKLEEDINRTFLKESGEAIWQLKQSNMMDGVGNATIEGTELIPESDPTSGPFSYIRYILSSELLAAFEPGDKRKNDWVGSTILPSDNGPITYYFPYKYKTGSHNKVLGAESPEYNVVLRLAEQYLIRAEAAAFGKGGGTTAAIDDLNELRRRANLTRLPYTLTQPELLAAIAKERQIEYYCEWGHRWFDLKRTGEASRVLSALPYNQPWLGDYQLLYPIPLSELKLAPKLIQNKEY